MEEEGGPGQHEQTPGGIGSSEGRVDEDSPSVVRSHFKGVSWMQSRGRAVQVDPVKPTLKAPGTKRLKLEYDEVLSSFAFKSNLRRYTAGNGRRRARKRGSGITTR